MYEARQWEGVASGPALLPATAGAGRRRLLQEQGSAAAPASALSSSVSQPRVLDPHTVAVNVTSLGGFYYLVGGRVPHQTGGDRQVAGIQRHGGMLSTDCE